MKDLLIYILACAGMTQILCYATLFDPIRPQTGFFGELFKCSMCIGFHVGYINYILFWFSNIHLFPKYYIGMFICAGVSSFCSYVLDKCFSDEGFSLYHKNK
jgi:hypothetical protein